MALNIDYFREFATLAEVMNYWEASERLYMNQSTLSKHIRSLEEELGVKLFDRTTRHIELTKYGQALLPYAREIMRTQFEYSAELRRLKDEDNGTITIGTIPPMAQYHVTGPLFGFRRAYNEYSIRILEADSTELIQALKEKRCELAFVRDNMPPQERSKTSGDQIVRIPYIEDRLVAVLPAGHPLAGQKSISLRDLKGDNMCFLKEGTLLYDLCRNACQSAGFIPNVVFNSHHIDSILDRVTRGNDTALMMDHHVKYPEGSGLPSDVPFSVVPVEPVIRTWVSLCFTREKKHSDACHAFVRYFTEQEASRSDVQW